MSITVSRVKNFFTLSGLVAHQDVCIDLVEAIQLHQHLGSLLKPDEGPYVKKPEWPECHPHDGVA